MFESSAFEPAAFPQANATLTGDNFEDDVGELPVWKGQTSEGKNVWISAWTAPFWTRVRFLVTGRLYLGLRSGFHPPVWLVPDVPFEEDS